MKGFAERPQGHLGAGRGLYSHSETGAADLKPASVYPLYMFCHTLLQGLKAKFWTQPTMVDEAARLWGGNTLGKSIGISVVIIPKEEEEEEEKEPEEEEE